MEQKPDKRIRVTPRAQEDLKNIGRYTERIWSKTQRNLYLRDIEARFHWLAENPLLGKHRTDICEGYYSFPEGQHVVFYLIGNNHIDTIGIPHKEMDTISYFLEKLKLKPKTRRLPVLCSKAIPCFTESLFTRSPLCWPVRCRSLPLQEKPGKSC